MKLFNKKQKEEIKKEKEIKEEQKYKAENLGKYLSIALSTGGRFDVKTDVIYIKPYDFEDISDLKSTKPEEIFETLIHILNRNKGESVPFDMADLKIEEVVDIEKALYGNAYSHVIKYPVFCDNEECPDNLSDKPKPYYENINLEDINTISLENLEDSWRESYKEAFTNDPTVFQEYLNKKYNGENKSIEEVLADFKIKEPFEVEMPDSKMLAIKFVNLGEFADSLKRGYSEFNYQLRKTHNKKYKHLNPDDAKIQKDIDLENIHISMMKKVNEYANAYTLVSFEGKIFDGIDEKLEFLRSMPVPYERRLKEVSASLRFGIDHKFESTCPSCGEKKINGLESATLISDLLPTANSQLIEHSDSDNAARKPNGFAGVRVYF